MNSQPSTGRVPAPPAAAGAAAAWARDAAAHGATHDEPGGGRRLPDGGPPPGRFPGRRPADIGPGHGNPLNPWTTEASPAAATTGTG